MKEIVNCISENENLESFNVESQSEKYTAECSGLTSTISPSEL